MRDHDPRRLAGRPRRVLQVRRRRPTIAAGGSFLRRVWVQRINLDDGWRGFGALRLGVFGDILNDRGCCENNLG